MKRSSIPWCTSALAWLSAGAVEAFAPIKQTVLYRQQQSAPPSTSTSINLWLPEYTDSAAAVHSMLTSASTYISTIDSDIANIPDDEFGKVFAGGGVIIFGSILSTIFVGFLIESSNSYADLVAETYAEQDFVTEDKKQKEEYLNSLGLSDEEKAETEEMVRAFREKKMRKAGTWTEEDEMEKAKAKEERDMFSDYQ